MLRIIFCCFIPLLLSYSATLAQNSEELLRSGKLLYQVNCARCHGMLGDGGTGPGLSRSYLPRASTDEKLANVIANGIPGTGMPSIWLLTEVEVGKIVKYVRYLGQKKEHVLVGNADNGKDLFDNSICTTCHIVSGIGGSLGPELTRIGLKRGQGYLAAAISHPGKSKPVDTNGFYQFLVVRVELKNGKTIEGIRINEDTFSIQLKDHSNHLYSFEKEQILSIEKIKDFSLMPSFIDQFSDSEINDIVAYLTSLE